MNRNLLAILACPNCGGAFALQTERLVCSSCGAEYPIRRGVPVFLEAELDDTHLRMEAEAELFERWHVKSTDRRQRAWAESREGVERVLHGLCDSFDGKALLNVGCGVDTLFTQFAPSKTLFVNLDIVENTLALLAERGCENVVCADARVLPFKPGSFDLVLCLSLLHHFFTAGMEGPLQTIASMLKPGGTILVQEPNKWAFLRLPVAWMPHSMQLAQRRLRALLTRKKVRPAHYEDHLSRRSIVRLLRKAGFTDIRAHPSPGYPGDGFAAETLTQFSKSSRFLATHLSYSWILTARKG